jgi:hypothetical protein
MAVMQHSDFCRGGAQVTTTKPRLVTYLPLPIDRRLRMQAAIRRWPIARVLADVLDRGLPSAEDLAAQIREDGSARDTVS